MFNLKSRVVGEALIDRDLTEQFAANQKESVDVCFDESFLETNKEQPEAGKVHWYTERFEKALTVRYLPWFCAVHMLTRSRGIPRESKPVCLNVRIK